MEAEWTQYEPFEVGQPVYASSGAYSDYGVYGVFRVLKAFRAVDFIATLAYSERIDIKRLTRDGFLEELTARELWTGEG